MRFIFLFFLSFFVLLPLDTTNKNISLNLQIPENFFWGLSKTIFNDSFKRLAFLGTLFEASDVKKVGQYHICFFQKEIKEQNHLKKFFIPSRLNAMLTQKCNTKSDDIFYFFHPGWSGFLYQTADSSMVCRDTNDCAVVLEKTNEKIVLGWLRFGVEVFKKTGEFEYTFTNDKYDLESYVEKNNFKDLDKYVELNNFLGGLGNQLFTYWSGVVYALKNNKTAYRTQELYLDKFLDLPVKNNQVHPVVNYRLLPEFVKRTFYKNTYECYHNHDFSFDDKCFSVGWYLQSWKNFMGYEDYIREHSHFKNEVTPKSKEMIQKMENENSVSVHVRRGDYIYQEYILLTQDYYSKAVEYIKNNVKNPHFYIFSNDIKWAKENIKIDAPHTYVDWTKKDYEDLQLMTYCKHFINANSSFSWWGSFLSKNKNKIVITPDKHAMWDLNWIKPLIAPNFVTIDVEKHYFNSKKGFVTEP